MSSHARLEALSERLGLIFSAALLAVLPVVAAIVVVESL